MMRRSRTGMAVVAVGAVALAWFGFAAPRAQAQDYVAPPLPKWMSFSSADVAEPYLSEPMPPGVQVVQTELEGPVFADARGRTLYRWASEAPGRNEMNQACDDRIITVSSSIPGGGRNSGGEIFYPEGVLPDVDKRVPCSAIWPPLEASADAARIGRWSVRVRADGFRQWTLDGFPVYTSHQDHEPGHTNAGSARMPGYFNSGGIARAPVGPRADVPAGFKVITTSVGRLLVTGDDMTVFASDKDASGKSRCYGECTYTWVPILAPQLAKAKGPWSFVVRGQGVKQWAYNGKALYTYAVDTHARGLEGAEVPGWNAVVVKKLPAFPDWVTVKDTAIAEVFADRNGKTLYVFGCHEPAEGDLSCDNPDTTQVYRLWMCGFNDADRCLKTWPPVLADANAKSPSKAWSIIWISKTGHRAKEGDRDAMRVWAFRGKPVYTFARDRSPEDVRGDGWCEQRCSRHGFMAFRLRSSELYPANGN